MNDLETLYRQLIMDHYKNPRNKGLKEEYETVHIKNPSCGDDISVQAYVENGVIKDVRHDGHGCSISMSSASVMSQLLKGKTVEEALGLIQDYYKMLKGEEPNEDLEDALAYQGVAKFPARYKCATIAWNAIEEAINKNK